jgi:hypothetical protein
MMAFSGVRRYNPLHLTYDLLRYRYIRVPPQFSCKPVGSFDVRKIKAGFKLRIRGPVVTKELMKYCATIFGYLDQFEDFLPQISEELGKAQAKLKYLEKNLPSQTRKSVRRVRKSIEKCDMIIENKEGVRRVCLEMKSVLEEIKDHQKDLQIGV